MADMVHVIGVIKDPKVPISLQMGYVDTGVINCCKANLVTHIVPRL